MAKYRAYNPDQLLLIPPDIREMVALDSPVWMIVEIINADLVRGLETSKSEEGNAAFNPLMMTRVLVWAYFNGVHSSREIGRKLWTDAEYLYISGMQRPNFRTICKFRKNNAEFLSVLYKKVYRAALEMDITKMGVISVDGSHFKGNVSGKKGCKRVSKWRDIEKDLDKKIADFEKKCDEVECAEDEEFGSDNSGGLPEEYRDAQKRRKKIKEVLEKLDKEEIEDKDPKMNLTDPDARYLKKGTGPYTMGYNVGIAVDENQLIASLDITNISSDQPGLKAAIEGIEDAIGGNIPCGTMVLCDAGYFSADNINYLDAKELDGYIAPSMDFKTNEYEKKWYGREFMYDSNEDALICRDCNKLARHTPKKPSKRDIEQFKAIEDCRGCTFEGECRPQGHHKHISFQSGISPRTKMTDKMLKDESKKIYKKRKTTVEPVFGDIKENLCLRSFNLRGFSCIVEAGLASLCHNIKKLSKMTNIFAVNWVYG